MKRMFDIAFSILGLLVLWPLLLLCAALVKFSSPGPALFRQTRVGQFGRPFEILKFRTMKRDGATRGLAVTRAGDPRITPVGRVLRRLKLDELPQLWNVLRGEMSLVGPRPEVPRYVALYTEGQRQVLRLRPGITDLATLQFCHEEEILAGVVDVERFYTEQCLPEKIRWNLEYAHRANAWEDTKLIMRTLWRILPGRRAGRPGAGCGSRRVPCRSQC